MSVEARIERGYLRRSAGSTAFVNNHGDSRGTGSDSNGHPAAERTSTTAGDGDEDSRTTKSKTRTANAEYGEHVKTARAGRAERSESQSLFEVLTKNSYFRSKS